MDKKKTSQKKKPSHNSMARYLGVGIQIMATVIFGIVAGYLIDTFMENDTPWFTLGLGIVTIIVALYQFIKESYK